MFGISSQKVRTFSPPFPDKFHAGDIAIAKERVDFCDGTWHVTGQRILISDENVHYYNVCHEFYDLAT